MSDLINRKSALKALRPIMRKSDYFYEIQKAIQDIPSAQSEQRWIPCSERLPEPRMAVLGYAPRYENIYALYYDSVMGWMIWSPIRDDCFPNSQGKIIAWMPLPEPYKEGEQNETD